MCAGSGVGVVGGSGGFGGVRVAVKDLIDVAGLPTTAGSRAVADRAKPADTDAACLAGLRAAMTSGQARLVGKVNLHELAYGITGINAAFGTPVNPLDPRRVPGGSSSGSATAVASGEADIAFGSDTGGSIRIPAACCGIAGLKTTWGRIPLTGVRPLAPSLDTVGPMARDIAGLVAGMALLEPGFTVAPTPPATIGLLTGTSGSALDAVPAIADAISTALHMAGFSVLPVRIPDLDGIFAAAITVLDAQAWQTNSDLVATAPDKIGGNVLARLGHARGVTAAQVAAAQQVLAGWQATLDSLLRQVDLLAAPTLTGYPPLLEDADCIFKIRAFTSPVNAAGLPALVLPVPVRGAETRPIPPSLQLIGPRYSEELLLAAGALVERAVGRLSLVIFRGRCAVSVAAAGVGCGLRRRGGAAARCRERICRGQRAAPYRLTVTHAGFMAHDEKVPVFTERVRQALLERRVLVLDGVLDDDNGTLLATQLLTLADQDPDSDIALWINSPGGSVPSMLAIRDVMRIIPCDVSTLVLGLAYSAGQFLLSAGTKGKRYALPHARILMHQGSAGIGGSAAEVELQAADLRQTRDTVLGLIAEDTGQPVERIFEDSRHDHWYTAAEAREYGFIDTIAATFGQLMPGRKRPFGLRPSATAANANANANAGSAS